MDEDYLDIKTIENKKLQLALYERMMGEPPSSITQEKAIIWGVKLKDSGRKHTTINKYLGTVCGEGGITFDDWHRGPELLPDWLSVSEITDMLHGMDKESLLGIRNYCILLFLYYTGVRASELCFLRTTDIHLDEGQVMIFGKNRKWRILPLLPDCVSMLRDYYTLVRPKLKPKSKTWFITQSGEDLSRKTLYKIVNDSGKIIDKEISPHTIRHTFATHLVANGISISMMADLLGHDNPETTMLYVHLSCVELRKMIKDHHPFYKEEAS